MTLDPEYELIQRFDCIRVTRAKNIRALFQSKKKKSRTLINSTNLVSENYFSVYSKFCWKSSNSCNIIFNFGIL